MCGAIHRAAGPELARACEKASPCPTGDARITPGFNLPARYAIHAVGPVWRGGGAGERALLASAYRAATGLMAEHGLRSIAFPAISTGIFGYLLDAATEVAVTTVRDASAAAPMIETVIFAAFSEDVLRAYEAAGIARG